VLDKRELNFPGEFTCGWTVQLIEKEAVKGGGNMSSYIRRKGRFSQ
jgi:hypothetical protein